MASVGELQRHRFWEFVRYEVLDVQESRVLTLIVVGELATPLEEWPESFP